MTSLDELDQLTILAGHCPICGEKAIDVNQWQAWCYVCDWSCDDLEIVDELRAALGRPARIDADEDQPKYYRFGSLPVGSVYEPWLKSFNYRDRCWEDGVSVFEGQIDGGVLILDFRKVDAMSGLCIAQAGDPVFEISGGRLIEEGDVDGWDIPLRTHGSDGEPLLRGTTKTLQARPLDVQIIAVIFTEGGEPRVVWENELQARQ